MAVIVLKDGVPVNNKSRKTWIYAAHELGEGKIKIGVTCNVASRMSALRGSYGSQIELLGIMPGAWVDEQRIHAYLMPSRHRGETYLNTDQIKDFIQKFLIPASQYGIKVRCSDKPYGRTRPLWTWYAHPGNIHKSIDKILAAPLSDQPRKVSRLFSSMIGCKGYDECRSVVLDRLGLDHQDFMQPFEGKQIIEQLSKLNQSRLGIDVEVVA